MGHLSHRADLQRADTVNWLVYALIIADKKGMTSQNIDTLMTVDPEAARLLRTSNKSNAWWMALHCWVSCPSTLVRRSSIPYTTVLAGPWYPTHTPISWRSRQNQIRHTHNLKRPIHMLKTNTHRVRAPSSKITHLKRVLTTKPIPTLTMLISKWCQFIGTPISAPTMSTIRIGGLVFQESSSGS